MMPGQVPNNQRDSVKNIFGPGDDLSVRDRKDQVKAQKMSYAEELKSQIVEQAANKVRERNERMGLGVAASHNAVSGYGAPAPFAQNQHPPPVHTAPFGSVPPPPQYNGQQFQQQPPQQFNQPPPIFTQFPPSQQYASPPSQQQQQQQQQYPPAAPPMSRYDMGGQHQQQQQQQQSPTYFQGANQFSPQGGYNQQQQQQQQQYGGQQNMGGYGGGYGNQIASFPPQPPNAKSAKDIYRMELEAQIRDKADAKRNEKARLRDEDMRHEHNMNPNSNQNGNRNQEQQQRNGYAQGGMQNNPQQNGMMGGGGGRGGYDGGGGGGYGGADNGGYGGGRGGYNNNDGDNGGNNNFRGGGQYQGGNGNERDGYGNGLPNSGAPVYGGNFRSGNAFANIEDMQSKAGQAKLLQDELGRQIEEKKYLKAMEKVREKQEVAHDEAKFKAEQEALSTQFHQERRKESGVEEDPAEVVAAAWRKAQADVEEAKRAKFAGKRTAGNAATAAATVADIGGNDEQPVGAGSSEAAAAAAKRRPALPLPTADTLSVAPLQTAPSLAHQGSMVPRAGLATEMDRLKLELAAESNKLREVVEVQSKTVAALKQHAERMEAQAETDKKELQKFKIDLLRRSIEGPEHLMRVMSDYPMAPQHITNGGPRLGDIVLDLPLPGAVQRRAVAAAAEYDMGPLIPQLMPGGGDGSYPDSMMGDGGRMSGGTTMGMRTFNPLESSMAADSVFIFPNGRELAHVNVMNNSSAPNTNATLGRLFRPPSLPSNLTPFRPVPEDEEAYDDSPSYGVGDLGGRGSNGSNGSSGRPGAPLVDLHGGGGVPASLPATAAQQQQARLLQQQREQEAQATAKQAAHRAAVAGNAGGRRNSRLGGAGTSAGLVPQRSLGSDNSSSQLPPLDIDALMSRNKEKLEMLKGIGSLSGLTDSEALDDFLLKFVNTKPIMPSDRQPPPPLRLASPSPAQIQARAQQMERTSILPPPPPPFPLQPSLNPNGPLVFRQTGDSLDVEMERIAARPGSRPGSRNGNSRHSNAMDPVGNGGSGVGSNPELRTSQQQQQRAPHRVGSPGLSYNNSVMASQISMTGSMAGDSTWVPAT